MRFSDHINIFFQGLIRIFIEQICVTPFTIQHPNLSTEFINYSFHVSPLGRSRPTVCITRVGWAWISFEMSPNAQAWTMLVKAQTPQRRVQAVLDPAHDRGDSNNATCSNAHERRHPHRQYPQAQNLTCATVLLFYIHHSHIQSAKHQGNYPRLVWK
jgi:hypothetical protein